MLVKLSQWRKRKLELGFESEADKKKRKGSSVNEAYSEVINLEVYFILGTVGGGGGSKL
jgi:hypothetical protein